MYRISAIALIIVFCLGCAGVSKTSSSAWRKTKSVFGIESQPEDRKITVETYPQRTVVSTKDSPNMQVKTEPKKVEVQTRPDTVSTQPSTTSVEPETDQENLTPEERALQEKIDEKVEELRRKHSGGGLFGIFK